MGDVAMTVPVIKNVLQQNPEVQITVVSNAFLKPLFLNIDRCYFHPAHLSAQHKGVAGIYQLYKELKALNAINAIADLHSVLRSSLLKIFFNIGNYEMATVDKGRKEKKALTRKKNKIFTPLTSTHERYAEVFRKIGLPVVLKNKRTVSDKQPVPLALQNIFAGGKKIIGIAPFAQYIEKMYPLQKMKAVVQQLAAENYTILLFGGGEKEKDMLQQWEDEMAGVNNLAGKFSFAEELAIISNLSVMISMDSANMHLASLFGVPVVSVWGATHFYAGFNGWGQDVKNIIEADLYCRPCSVFGNKPCYRGDHACMHLITPQLIIERIKNY